MADILMTFGSPRRSDGRGVGGLLQDEKGVTGRGVQLSFFSWWKVVKKRKEIPKKSSHPQEG